jgi:four helix bundle protein
MKYERFEDLPVWQMAVELATKIFEWTQEPLLRGKGDLANQLQRAALSISNNIAEGFERGSTKELLNFLYIARGSAGEVRSMLCIVERINTAEKLQTDVSDLKQCCESISRQIRGWAKSLQNSDIEGPKHLNDSTRKEYEARKKRESFETERQAWKTKFEAKLRADAEKRCSNVSNEELQSE